MCFWGLISDMMIFSVPISWNLSWLLTENGFFSVLKLWHTYPYSRPKRASKKDILAAKNDHLLLIMKVYFQHEVQVDIILLSYILTIYCEFLLFQFFSLCKPTHITIITGVQNKHITRRKTVIFFSKMLFLKLPFESKVNRMPIA